MKKMEKQKIIARYNERLKKYGYDPKSLGWSKGRQHIRFKALSKIGDLNNCSILDVGCGFGDLYGFLIKRGLNIKYTGVDINPKLIERVKKIYPNAHFIVMDIEEEDIESNFDWVFASGIFNFKLSDNKTFIENMLKKMFKICNKGIAIDFMSNYVDFKNEDTYYTSPEKIFSFCKTLSRRITLRCDYLPFEFCVYIFKNDRIDKRNVFAEFDEGIYGQ